MSDTLARIKKHLEDRYQEDYHLFEDDVRLLAVAQFVDETAHGHIYPATDGDWEWLYDQLFDFAEFLLDRVVVKVVLDDPQENSESNP